MPHEVRNSASASASAVVRMNIRMKRRLTNERCWAAKQQYNLALIRYTNGKTVACNHNDRTAPIHLFRITHIYLHIYENGIEKLEIFIHKPFFASLHEIQWILFHFSLSRSLALSGHFGRHSYWHCCKQCVHCACVIAYMRAWEKRALAVWYTRIDDDERVSE